ncbi:MATH and LRR domain-containing protein PFE0570w-like [Chelonus insularis]|uniref:MATH and LRR domain-containing protein PFE0570w-like n=1 Tax=Chelonus insularis TaxID=460826 RepID=UPI00158B8A65|nr:MATH and LRR domain-containing protein PFE0570w-like [Chelonus insularis]XP_034946756.1 MATH and LRR domain-containing protein PFE0570w-like [Chelonus insularis]
MRFASISFVFLFIWCTTGVVESHSVMTHASLDVGNIISVVIPENSPTNINVDQLTLDFRRQLERIKQNQLLKSDYKSVSLKNKLSDISNNRDQKGFLTKTYQGKINYYLPQKFRSKTNLRNLKKKFRGYRRYPLSYDQKKKLEHYNNAIINRDQRIKHEKHGKNSQTNPIRRDFYQFHKFDNAVDDDNYQEKSSGDDKNISKDWNPEEAVENSINKINQVEVPSDTYKNTEQRVIQLSEPRVESSCSVVNKANRVGNTRDVTANEFEKNGAVTNDCTEEIDVDGQVISSCYNDSIVNYVEPTKSSNKEEINYGSKDKNYEIINNGNVNETMNNNDDDKVKQEIFPINIQVEDFKEVEQIIQNPEDIIDRFNSTDTDNDIKIDGEDNTNTYVAINDNLQNAALLTSINRENKHSSNMDNSKGLTNSLYEYVDKNRNVIEDQEPVAIASERISYHNGMQKIQKTKPDNAHVNIDNENFEIRIRRSVNDNVLLKKSTKAHIPKPDVKKWKSKAKEKVKWVPMKTSMKSKNSWKLYPNVKSIN